MVYLSVSTMDLQSKNTEKSEIGKKKNRKFMRITNRHLRSQTTTVPIHVAVDQHLETCSSTQCDNRYLNMLLLSYKEQINNSR